ncbi:hypothetical protein TCAL_14563 [Tigriopus californicus]|uniref:Integrase catalytic domain-containing protein n=1 Tax=Tigriopus californicus TaxID=6832 RepID=A0A553PB96_TIGCA|nr:hypothetical protein TCAL_14563 [Tigriopus californicus]
MKLDNGPQFRAPFDDLCREFGIHHNTSTAYHLTSNSLADAGAKAVKYLLVKIGGLVTPTLGRPYWSGVAPHVWMASRRQMPSWVGEFAQGSIQPIKACLTTTSFRRLVRHIEEGWPLERQADL